MQNTYLVSIKPYNSKETANSKKYFNDTNAVFDYILSFYNKPVKADTIAILKEDLVELEGNPDFFMSSTINNGSPTQNFHLELEYITVQSNYVIPKAWGENSSLIEVFPEDHLELITFFDKWLLELDECCVDSYRIGLVEDKESMTEYQEYITCCGSDDIIKEINGKLYSFGCNFGH
jgi:hypothetical protein